MKSALLPIGLIALVCTGTAVAAGKLSLKDANSRFGYTVGYQLGKNLRGHGFHIDPRAAAQGMVDAVSGTPPKLSPDEMRAALQAYNKREHAKLAVAAKKNLADGRTFLAKNKRKPGVVTLPSGVEYQVLRQGKGPKPGPTDTVTVQYRGTLIDGSEFDSSYARHKAATFAVDQVIKGWQEVLPRMRAGSKWHIVIPSELAYGANGAGPKIGPNSVLVFDIDLLSVKAPNGRGK